MYPWMGADSLERTKYVPGAERIQTENIISWNEAERFVTEREWSWNGTEQVMAWNGTKRNQREQFGCGNSLAARVCGYGCPWLWLWHSHEKSYNVLGGSQNLRKIAIEAEGRENRDGQSTYHEARGLGGFYNWWIELV